MDFSSISPSRLLPGPNMATAARIILAAVLLVSGVAGQDPNKKPKFTYPPNGSNKIFNKMDTVVVTYTSFYDTAVLYTFCDPGIGKLSASDLLHVLLQLPERGRT